MKKIAIVIPSFNEESNLIVMLEALKNVCSKMNYSFSFVFVDDGSSDKTISILKELSVKENNLFYVELSRNFGHQNALKAGIDLVKDTHDAIISMDGDLQHPPALIPTIISYWESGNDVVYTIREEDKNLSYFKNKTSNLFYKLMNKLADVKFEPGTADFRLIDRKVAEVFSNLNENELFIRGLINWLGFTQIGIPYKPHARFSGQSKYTLSKMIRFAIQGITSFSTKPLYFAIVLGISLTSFAFLFYLIYILYSLYFGHVISGWTSVISTIVFFGGLNLSILGIIGIYIGKIFIQSKNRPNYIIKETNFK